ncbi:hypothetical protein [Nocardia sp. NPDC004604]|uniref:hypothetical protein n=1 Tax=Nocardia sp. NPDC004604 TaxID=3157013 RepID=UPI0033AA70D4
MRDPQFRRQRRSATRIADIALGVRPVALVCDEPFRLGPQFLRLRITGLLRIENSLKQL